MKLQAPSLCTRRGGWRGHSRHPHEQDEGHPPGPRRTQLSPIPAVTDFPKLYSPPFQPLASPPTPEPCTTHASLIPETTGADGSPDQHDRFLARTVSMLLSPVARTSRSADLAFEIRGSVPRPDFLPNSWRVVPRPAVPILLPTPPGSDSALARPQLGRSQNRA